MTITLIVLLITYLMISEIIGRLNYSLPERHALRFSVEIEQPRGGFKALISEGSLLSAPGQILPIIEDRPLSGPWDIPSAHKEDPPQRSLEPESFSEAEDLSQPTLEYEDELSSQQRQQEQAVDHPLFLERLELPQQYLKSANGEVDNSSDQSGTLSVQSFPVEIPKLRQRNAGNPLTVALCGKNALVGSLIIGEVLNSRGGRMKGRR